MPLALLIDTLHAARLARRQPGFVAAAILRLAVGIGAAAAVFAVVNAVLLVDMAFRDPDRLVWLYNARTERDRAPLSLPDLEDYRRAARTLDGLAPFTNWTANLTGNGDAERLEGFRVAGNFFDLLEVVGVRVRNVKQYGLDGSPTADLYVPVHQMPSGQASLIAGRIYWVVRAQADGRMIAGDARGAIHGVDPDVATSSTRTLEEELAASIGSRRINVRLLERFSQVTMLSVTAVATWLPARGAADTDRSKLLRI